MNLNSDNRPSMEELKQRNLPQEVVAENEQKLEPHPTQEDWFELLDLLSALYHLTAEQYDWLRNRRHGPSTELIQLVKDTAAIRATLEQERNEQVGRKNERHFSLHLPSIDLPHLSPAWLLLPLALLGLWALWYSLDALWNTISPLFM